MHRDIKFINVNNPNDESVSDHHEKTSMRSSRYSTRTSLSAGKLAGGSLKKMKARRNMRLVQNLAALRQRATHAQQALLRDRTLNERAVREEANASGADRMAGLKNLTRKRTKRKKEEIEKNREEAENRKQQIQEQDTDEEKQKDKEEEEKEKKVKKREKKQMEMERQKAKEQKEMEELNAEEEKQTLAVEEEPEEDNFQVEEEYNQIPEETDDIVVRAEMPTEENEKKDNVETKDQRKKRKDAEKAEKKANLMKLLKIQREDKEKRKEKKMGKQKAKEQKEMERLKAKEQKKMEKQKAKEQKEMEKQNVKEEKQTLADEKKPEEENFQVEEEIDVKEEMPTEENEKIDNAQTKDRMRKENLREEKEERKEKDDASKRKSEEEGKREMVTETGKEKKGFIDYLKRSQSTEEKKKKKKKKKTVKEIEAEKRKEKEIWKRPRVVVPGMFFTAPYSLKLSKKNEGRLKRFANIRNQPGFPFVEGWPWSSIMQGHRTVVQFPSNMENVESQRPNPVQVNPVLPNSSLAEVPFEMCPPSRLGEWCHSRVPQSFHPRQNYDDEPVCQCHQHVPAVTRSQQRCPSHRTVKRDPEPLDDVSSSSSISYNELKDFFEQAESQLAANLKLQEQLLRGVDESYVMSLVDRYYAQPQMRRAAISNLKRR